MPSSLRSCLQHHGSLPPPHLHTLPLTLPPHHPLPHLPLAQVIFRARWALQDAVPPSWEVCALGHCELPLLSAHFYKQDHLALLHKAGTSKPGTTLALKCYAELEFMPLRAMESGGEPS